MLTCPNFIDNQCAIYETRPLCCRSFPNRTEGTYCSTTTCKDDCNTCLDKCCTHLDIPDNSNVYDLLNITCSECTNKYCK